MFKIHHVAISVSNIEKSFEFYKVFGFKKVLTWENEEKDLKIFHLKLWEIFLELFCFKKYIEMPINSTKLSTDIPQIWVKHFWIEVENLEEIKIDFIKMKLVKDIEIKNWKTGIKYFFIKDPDWILLEFIQDNRKI